MKITKRKLLRIIKEEKELLEEQRKWQAMLLKEDSGGIASALFSGIKELGSQAPEMMVQWLKANPDMLEGLLDDMVDDPKIKDIIMKFMPQGEAGDNGAPAAENGEEKQKKEVQESRRRRRVRAKRRK